MHFSGYSFLWVTPFLSFLVGYQLVSWFSHNEVLRMPIVLGMPLQHAIKELSSHQLNARILKEKEDPEIPEGIVISQSPEGGHTIKSHQSVFLVVTRKPPAKKAPLLCKLKVGEIEALARDQSLFIKIHRLESAYPEGICFAQSPEAQEPLCQDQITAYVSSGVSPVRLFPLCKGQELHKVQEFLKEHSIESQVFHLTKVYESHDCSNCVIIDQRPLAGSLIDLRKPPTVQFTVAAK